MKVHHMPALKKPTFPVGTSPLHWQTRSGTPVTIRHITADDAGLLVEMYGRLSERTLALRFATVVINVPVERVIQEATHLATLNPENADALVALIDEGGHEQIIAVARLAGANDVSAEFAMTVRDDFQGQGVGAYLFDLLIQIALVRGLECLTASVLAENRPMIELIRRCGFPSEVHTTHGESEVTIFLRQPPSD
jgi:acetyltransferase